MINSNQLQSGDLIFYFNSIKEAEHIALYAGSKDGVPYVLHATSAPHNAVMLTHLKEADSGCEYRVMRALDNFLSLKAKEILLTWVEYAVPFASVEKRDGIFNLMDKMGGIDNPVQSGAIQDKHGKKTYAKNYSQYLLMANHLPFIPLTYTSENKIEGLLCSEAIIAAFNIALLMMHATQIGDQWVIDSAPTFNDFIKLLNNPLPFDAKEALPNGIYKHCLDSPMQWIDQGSLTIILYSEPDSTSKADWREFKSALQAVALENTTRFLESQIDSSENHELNLYFAPPSTGSDRSLLSSPRGMRWRSASTSSIESNEKDSHASKLRESPIYSTFFKSLSPIVPCLETRQIVDEKLIICSSPGCG